MKRLSVWASAILCICILLCGCEIVIIDDESSISEIQSNAPDEGYTVYTVPVYNDQPYVPINNNVPYFKESDITKKSFEKYGELDSLRRCTLAYACVSKETMPTEKRGNISQVKPSGWHSVKYDFVDGQSLYNRCHLIGYQLTAENANERNLITGTRYLNVEGMLPFENMIADYIKETKNHVMYRVTPIFDADNLVARGVEMEAYSVEDKGEGVSFNVYAYNVQPGVTIDYKTGDSKIASSKDKTSTNKEDYYIINTNNNRFHLPDCPSVSSIKEKNKKEYHGSREKLISDGYEPCTRCNP